MQQFIGEGRWEDDRILKRHWLKVDQTLGAADSLLFLDGSELAKQGSAAVGTQRQDCGELGKWVL